MASEVSNCLALLSTLKKFPIENERVCIKLSELFPSGVPAWFNKEHLSKFVDNFELTDDTLKVVWEVEPVKYKDFPYVELQCLNEYDDSLFKVDEENDECECLANDNDLVKAFEDAKLGVDVVHVDRCSVPRILIAVY